MAASWTWSGRILAGDVIGWDPPHQYTSWMRAWAPLETWHRWWGGRTVFHQAPLWAYTLAGQPDQSDSSRFRIEFEMNGVRNALGGRLRDDGSVELQPLTGRLVHHGGNLDAVWCPDGSHREPSLLDTPISPGSDWR
jgi:hypothetical protein